MPGIEHFSYITSVPPDSAYRVGSMAPILYGKKVKTKNINYLVEGMLIISGWTWIPTQVWLQIPFSEALYSTMSQKSHPDSHTLSKYSSQQGHFKTQVLPGSLSQPSILLVQLIYNPLQVLPPFVSLLRFVPALRDDRWMMVMRMW